jgi:hypothetical protein
MAILVLSVFAVVMAAAWLSMNGLHCLLLAAVLAESDSLVETLGWWLCIAILLAMPGNTLLLTVVLDVLL